MNIVCIRKAGICCSICLNEIAVNEEAFRFFNRDVNPNMLKAGHILLGVGVGQIHFRHLKCQYKIKPRKVDFDKWIKRIKFEIELRKNRKKYLRKIKNEKR